MIRKEFIAKVREIAQTVPPEEWVPTDGPTEGSPAEDAYNHYYDRDPETLRADEDNQPHGCLIERFLNDTWDSNTYDKLANCGIFKAEADELVKASDSQNLAYVLALLDYLEKVEVL